MDLVEAQKNKKKIQLRQAVAVKTTVITLFGGATQRGCTPSAGSTTGRVSACERNEKRYDHHRARRQLGQHIRWRANFLSSTSSTSLVSLSLFVAYCWDLLCCILHLSPPSSFRPFDVFTNPANKAPGRIIQNERPATPGRGREKRKFSTPPPARSSQKKSLPRARTTARGS